MTIDDAIKHAEEVADKKEREKQKWEKWLETDSDYRAVTEKVSCELCAEEHRQLAEWLRDYKRLKEQKPKWIPCSERLPQYTADYIVTVGINNGGGMYYEVRTALYQIRFNQWIVYESEKTLVGEVIAWQDSLEPYKAESEVNNG